ncbi:MULTISPECIES: toprim domain-containing protein [unclassified Thioalkalivibrio]|uniref:toprim domain-containing protein n=1 Tax=unclassified Thioalkalivibrio TaxID=2621013 RepID=UPI00035C3F23|nr:MULTISPECIES: toprim domain-containing protein [unclassified Thioalkalivibrio]
MFGFGKKEQKPEANVADTLEWASKRFQEAFWASEEALGYMLDRGFSEETVKDWEIGYSPRSSAYLATDLDKEVGVEAGLLIETDRGAVIDRFRDRIMIPIRAADGTLAGFGGRAVDDNAAGPKYLNSSESEHFQKSSILFGAHRLGVVTDLEPAFVVEGYMDVIKLSQYGIPNVVASMGTAMTEENLRNLNEAGRYVLFAMDGDNPGRAAMRKIRNGILSDPALDFEAAFVLFPEGSDPDDFITEKGREQFEAFMRENVMALTDAFVEDFAARGLTKSAEGRFFCYGEIEDILSRLPSPHPIETNLSKELSEKLKIPEALWVAALEDKRRERNGLTRPVAPESAVPSGSQPPEGQAIPSLRDNAPQPQQRGLRFHEWVLVAQYRSRTISKRIAEDSRWDYISQFLPLEANICKGLADQVNEGDSIREAFRKSENHDRGMSVCWENVISFDPDGMDIDDIYETAMEKLEKKAKHTEMQKDLEAVGDASLDGWKETSITPALSRRPGVAG